MGFGPKALPSGNKWGGSKVNPYAGGKVPRQKKGGGATKPAPTKTTPAAAPKTIQQLAHELVQAQLVPYYQQLRADEAAQSQSERARQAAVKGFTTSMVNLLKGQPAALAADYRGAIDQTAALATQSSDALRAANPDTQNQQLLAAIGAPESQRAQLTELANRAFSGGAAVLQHTRGTLPGQTLTGSQLAQVVHARNLPSIAAAQGTQALRSFLAQAADERGKLARERSDLRGQIPGLEQQTLMGLQTQQAAQQAAQTAAEAVQWERDFKVSGLKQTADLANQVFGLNVAKAKTDAGIETRKLGQIDTAASKASGFLVRKDGTQVLGKNKQPIPVANQSDGLPSPELSKVLGYLVDKTGAPIAGANGKVIPIPKNVAANPPSAELSRLLGYIVRKDGTPVLYNGKPVAIPKNAPKKTGQLTVKERADFKGSAYSIASEARSGVKVVPDPNDPDEEIVIARGDARWSETPWKLQPLTYAEAAEEMLKDGVPLAIAREALNHYYRNESKKYRNIWQQLARVF